ncbi:MAG: hypothetical protein ACF8NJ_03400 [Phycisphaerales bacterium JB038]
MSESRSKGKMIRMVVLLGSLCSSLYFAPSVVEKLRGGSSATDMLLTQYLPAEAKARLDELEATGGVITTDKGVEVPECFIEVTPGQASQGDDATKKKKIHRAGGSSSSTGARVVRGGS